MNFKTPFKVLTTAALIGTLSLSAVAPGVASATNTVSTLADENQAATAVEQILYTKDGKTYQISLEEYLLLEATGSSVVANSEPLGVVSPTTGKFYTLEDFLLTEATHEGNTEEAFKALDADETKALTENPFKVTVDENGEVKIEDPSTTPVEDFKVTEIAAITQTIANKKDQTLSFTVNGDKTVTAADLIEKGYTVKFAYNKDISGLSAEAKKAATEQGIVDATNAKFAAGFNYSVVVTDEEGNEIGDATDFKTVKVTSADTAVSVDGVKLVKDTKDYALDYVTEGNTGVSFAATGAKNAFGEALKTVPKVKSVKALNPTVAYYENKQIVASKEGTAKFEVTFEGIEKPVTYEVVVKAAAAADSIKEEALKIKTEQAAVVTVLDQHGADYTLTDVQGITATIEGKDTDVTEAPENGKLKLTADDFKTAGTYNVVIKNATKTLGTVKVEVVDASNSVATEYKITDDAEKVLDLTVGENQNDKKSYKLVGIADGVDLDSLTKTVDALKEANQGEGELVVESSNKDVVVVDKIANTNNTINGKTGEFNVTAQKAGTAKVTVSFVAGAVKKELKSVDVTVKNDTPQYTQDNVSLLKGENATEAPTALKVTALNNANIEAGLAYKDAKLAVGSVSSFKIVNQEIDKDGNLTGTLLVTTNAAYGGAVLEFPVVVKATEVNSIAQFNTFTINGGNGITAVTGTDAIKNTASKIEFDLTKVKNLFEVTASQNAPTAGGDGRILADVKLSKSGYVASKLFAGTDSKGFYANESTTEADWKATDLATGDLLFYVKLADVTEVKDGNNTLTGYKVNPVAPKATTYTVVWTKAGETVVEKLTVETKSPTTQIEAAPATTK